MRAKDFMYGDILNTSFGIGKVIAIDKIGLTLENKDGQFDIEFFDEEAWMLEIPLTTEILTKNFGEMVDGKFFDGNEFYELFIREVNDGTWLVRKDGLEFSCFPHQQAMVCYVHELQQCLRLFGIDKKIEI